MLKHSFEDANRKMDFHLHEIVILLFKIQTKKKKKAANERQSVISVL